MTKIIVRLISLVFVLSLLVCASGCGKLWGGLQNSGSPVNQTPQPYYYVYAANNSSNTVIAYSADAKTGSLTPIGLTNVGSTDNSIYVDPSCRFAYVDNWTDSIYAYFINPLTGTLVTPAASGFPISIGPGTNHAYSVGLDPLQRFFYVANFNAASIMSFNANTTTLGISSQNSNAVSATANTLAFEPTGKYLFDLSDSNNTLQSFTIDQTFGTLTLVTSDVEGNLAGIVSDALGRFVFAAQSTGWNDVLYYQITGVGGLVKNGSSPVGGTQPNALIVEPTGKYLYATNVGSGDVSAMTINATTGQLTHFGTNQSLGGVATHAISGAVDPDGKFLFLAHPDQALMYVFKINSDGSLTPVPNQPFSTQGTQPLQVQVCRMYR